MLEREIFLRSFKHVFNRILREDTGETDLLLSDIVCHVLNCMLAPTALVNALNTGDIKFDDETVQSKFQFFPDDTRPEPRRSSSAHKHTEQAEKAETAPNTQAKLKKKPKRKQPEAPVQATKVDKPKTIADILIAHQPIPGHEEPEEFNVSDLFSLPIISTGLYRLYTPKGLTLKPSEIYAEVRAIAKARFSYDLPEDSKKLICLASPLNKIALLREICQKVGIQMEFDHRRPIALSNNLSEILA
jgi:hypothetical protein